VTLPRTQEEAHVTFSKEGLTRLRNGLTKAGLDARFFAWPPEQKSIQHLMMPRRRLSASA
jgi:hypothetical protein